MPLVFKACLMEMGENLLLDFRLSKVTQNCGSYSLLVVNQSFTVVLL